MNSVYLVMVDPTANNNKYYRMIPDENGNTFIVQYGRVGNLGYQTETYNMGKWQKKLKEKLKKGYVDQTRLVAIPVIKRKENREYAPISNASIASIVRQLQAMARQAIDDNYTISSDKVTKTMIDEAQHLISQLNLSLDTSMFNDLLIELFRTIPRKMKHVADELVYHSSHYSRIIQREQDLLDVMRGQVVTQNAMNEEEVSSSQSPSLTILDKMGLQFNPVTSEDRVNINHQLGSLSGKFSNAWGVVNVKTQNKFDHFVNTENIQNKKLLWHGSRNENWWSIINTGLMLRPNAVTTGKMFGYGIYFAPSAQKSFGYTSYNGSYWAGGRSNIAFMSLFDVAYGKPYDIYSHSNGVGSMTYETLQRVCNGAHCLHAHAGNILHNDEIVIYKENQVTIKYLVELK